MEKNRTQPIEQLLMRIHELEYGLAQLQQQISSLVAESASSSSRRCPCGSGITWHSLTEVNYFNILQSIDEPIHITDSNGCIIYRSKLIWFD